MQEFINRLEKNNFKYKVYEKNNIIIVNGDCLKVMELIEDNGVDLVLTDPPYGIGFSREVKENNGWKAKPKKDWDDKIPSKNVFKEMFRISKDQLIWGGITLLITYLLVKDGTFGIKDKETLALLTEKCAGHLLIKL